MATIKKPICTLGIIGILTFILSIVAAQAEQPIDCLVCLDMKISTVMETQDSTIMGLEGMGIVIDNTESKFFDNSTVYLVGLMKIDKGRVSRSMLGKYLDPSGDFYVIEVSQVGTENSYKFIYGTGKYTGITGAGNTLPF